MSISFVLGNLNIIVQIHDEQISRSWTRQSAYPWEMNILEGAFSPSLSPCRSSVVAKSRAKEARCAVVRELSSQASLERLTRVTASLPKWCSRRPWPLAPLPHQLEAADAVSTAAAVETASAVDGGRSARRRPSVDSKSLRPISIFCGD